MIALRGLTQLSGQTRAIDDPTCRIEPGFATIDGRGARRQPP
ncbi:hypothetical protein [Mycobacterium sp.]|nr:hypothetical protein [Mycobacterium sp.]HME48720.1 hypothetical protein [Mycobacterium sp.]